MNDFLPTGWIFCNAAEDLCKGSLPLTERTGNFDTHKLIGSRGLSDGPHFNSSISLSLLIWFYPYTDVFTQVITQVGFKPTTFAILEQCLTN